MITEIVVLFILILLNAFFAASEMALITLNDNKVKAMANSGHKKSILLLNLLSEPSRFLATIQIGITLAGFMASALAADSFAGRLAEFLNGIGVPVPLSVLETISLIVITLVLSYFTLVLGELVPKRIAMQKAEPISMFVVMPLTILSKVTAPFVKFLSVSTNLFVRLLGIDPNADKEQVTEEEIRMMVEVGNENGTIQGIEKMMINNIFELDNKIASDIMIHRNRIVSIPQHFSLHQIANLINMEKYSRFPVYEHDIDNIIGILHSKDLIRYLEKDVTDNEQIFDIKSIIRKPYVTLEYKHADELFREMQINKAHMAIVMDEYGGTAGIITIEDLLEEIVGNILDEHDVEEIQIEQIDENSFIMNGLLHLREVRDFLNVELSSDEYDTLNGFLIGQFHGLPDKDERPSVELEGFIFAVEEMDDKIISKVRVSRVV
ncbi:hemolysin [Paenibacillus crassostreae]|uniref:Hemolysin n=2 Tax=Paenibacillus crassostreae TaxID=1763538 RepID=A0A167FIR4_9BACL|nr:hemolysin family protein [Paenibacillus crassostreae]AOZ94364.1 hemolysin [Paenibacillus crassostreae]OAB76599.1 hemolysin [Paenibacillus crassostreae]